MKARIEEVQNLIRDKFRNNQSWFSEELNISRSYLNKVLNGKMESDSPKFCNALMKYCKENGLDYNQYIKM